MPGVDVTLTEWVTLGGVTSGEECSEAANLPPSPFNGMRTGSHGTVHAGNVIICAGYSSGERRVKSDCKKLSHSTG